MSRSTISTFQLFQAFPDEEAARLYLESRLWPNGVVCPNCKSNQFPRLPTYSLKTDTLGLFLGHGKHKQHGSQ